MIGTNRFSNKTSLKETSGRSLRAMCIGMSTRDEKFQASYL